MNQQEDEFGSSREERIKQEASDWVAKDDRGFTADEQDAFFDWLAERPKHSKIYNTRELVWKEMDVFLITRIASMDTVPDRSAQKNGQDDCPGR